MLTVKQAATKLKCSVRAVQRACQRLAIPKHGASYLITDDDLSQLRSEVRDGPGNPGYADPEYQRKLARKRVRKQP